MAEPALGNDGICPAVGTSAGCDFVITVNSPTSVTTSMGSLSNGGYDNYGNSLVGVVNDTGSTIYIITISSNSDIFGFGGNGIDGYNADGVTISGANPDLTGYGGPDGYFTSISGSLSNQPETGTVNFANGGIQPGYSDYFSLSAVIDLSSAPIPDFTQVPEPASLTILSMGMFAITATCRFRRKP